MRDIEKEVDLEISKTKKEPEFHALLAQVRRYTGMARADAFRKKHSNDMDVDEFGNPKNAPEPSNSTPSYPATPYPPPSYPAPGYGWQGPIWNVNDWDPWNEWNSWDSWSWEVQNGGNGYEDWGGKSENELNAIKGKGKGYQTPTTRIAKNVDCWAIPN